jgi:hypothetical protein
MTLQRLPIVFVRAFVSSFVVVASLGFGGVVGCAATASGSATVATNQGQSGSGESGAVAAVPPATPPATAEACKTCNGVWAVHGLSQTPSCNCRTTDGGKACRDGNNCQGMCIAAENPETQVVEAGPRPVPLSEPPPMICAD